jgi:hypothetical protein
MAGETNQPLKLSDFGNDHAVNGHNLSSVRQGGKENTYGSLTFMPVFENAISLPRSGF